MSYSVRAEAILKIWAGILIPDIKSGIIIGSVASIDRSSRDYAFVKDVSFLYLFYGPPPCKKMTESYWDFKDCAP